MMVDQMKGKPSAERVKVTVGDMASTRLESKFSLVYLVYNTITNLLTQDEQVACFENAAFHLEPGGYLRSSASFRNCIVCHPANKS